MAKSNGLNVDVNVRLSVPDEVAERIMTLLAMYLDDHPEKVLLMECDENRKHHGRIEDLSAPDSCDMALVIAHASDIPMHTERIWMETRAGELWPVQYRYWDGDLLHFLDKYTPLADAVFDAGQYLTTWRCWTKKPSEEQRETEEWK